MNAQQIDLEAYLHDLPAPSRNIDTSLTAAASVRPYVGHLRLLALKYIESQGEHGATLDEVSVHCRLLMQSASARVRELAQAGFIRDTGNRRTTRTGRPARVYRVTEHGRTAV
jgi:DNA-binding MarR family transcriptional regulator